MFRFCWFSLEMEKIRKGMIYEKKGVGQGPFKQTGRQQQQHEKLVQLWYQALTF